MKVDGFHQNRLEWGRDKRLYEVESDTTWDNFIYHKWRKIDEMPESFFDETTGFAKDWEGEVKPWISNFCEQKEI